MMTVVPQMATMAVTRAVVAAMAVWRIFFSCVEGDRTSRSLCQETITWKKGQRCTLGDRAARNRTPLPPRLPDSGHSCPSLLKSTHS